MAQRTSNERRWAHTMVVIRRIACELRRIEATFARLAVVLLGRALRTAVMHRRVLIGVISRAAWWASLVLLLWGAQRLADAPRFHHLDNPEFQAFLAFAIGLGMSGASSWIAPERHVRYCAFVLAASHGGLALLAWWVLHP